MKRSLLTTCSVLLIGIFIGRAMVSAPQTPRSATAQQAPATDRPQWQADRQVGPIPLTPEEQTSVGIYEQASHSVVNIDTKTVQYDRFFGLPHEAQGSGSGAVIDQQGHIITNFHVVDGAGNIDVTLATNESYPAELVGKDREHDIAVLKIDAPVEQLHPITVGASSHLRVGQRVFVLGNPFGWDNTMTTGIISSLNRNLPSRIEGRQMQSLIQTDAAMNPGNSGGPLLDSSGQMIGMSVAIATKTGQNAGVGFAIPIDRIKSILPQLIEHGRIVRADIGIVSVMETGQGLAIVKVAEGGPAAEAGLRGFRRVTQQRQQGGFVYKTETIDRSYADRIVAVDGEPVNTGVGFRDKIWDYKPGDTVTLTIVRQGRKIDVPVRLRGN